MIQLIIPLVGCLPLNDLVWKNVGAQTTAPVHILMTVARFSCSARRFAGGKMPSQQYVP